MMAIMQDHDAHYILFAINDGKKKTFFTLFLTYLWFYILQEARTGIYYGCYPPSTCS